MREFRILEGDVLARLREIESGSVRCCVTSPPYWGLRDYGVDGQLGLERTPEEYVAALVAVFREVRRVLRDDGTLWLNLGDSYAGSLGAQSRGGPPSDSSTLRGNGHVGGGPKIKSLSATQIAAHPKGQTHTGSLARTPGLKPKDLVGIPWRVAFALQADWWYLRSDIIWAKPSAMPESVKDRPTKAHEYIFLLAKSPRYYYDADAIREPLAGTTVERSKYPRFQNPKNRLANKIGVAKNVNYGSPKTEESAIKRMLQRGKRNKRTVWTVATRPFKGAHFAVFPPDLIEPCILAGAPEKACPHCGAPWERVTERKTINKEGWGPSKKNHREYLGEETIFKNGYGRAGNPIVYTIGWKPTCQCENNDGSGRGIVLDPFFGSGTTGVVAAKHGRQWIGIELNPEYIRIAEERLGNIKIVANKEVATGERQTAP